MDRTLGLFLCYAAGLILGVAGPVIYTVWMRGRPLADLGLTTKNWQQAIGLGLVLGVIQFFLTLYGYDLPVPADWVPLLTMSLMVGLFEAIFFRGFIQTRLSASLGPVPGVVTAAALYALYHVGYGMGMREMAFLFALGLVYGIAYACVNNVLVLWPLLIPPARSTTTCNPASISCRGPLSRASSTSWRSCLPPSGSRTVASAERSSHALRKSPRPPHGYEPHSVRRP